MNRVKKILLIVNFRKQIPEAFIKDLVHSLRAEGSSVWILPDSRERFYAMALAKEVELVDNKELLFSCDMAIVLGGDGSIISASTEVSGYGVPILGINFGHVGYLAELEATEVARLGLILSGEYIIEERMMMEADIVHSDGVTDRLPPMLNDIVLSSGPVARLLDFEVHCDGVAIQRCRADGLIVATPTGSTAYSMSAGGPILSPELDAFCLTPICPHSLSNRPVIIPGESTVKVSAESSSDNFIYVTADGHSAVRLDAGDVIEVRRSPLRTRLVRLGKNSFLSALNSKLQ